MEINNQDTQRINDLITGHLSEKEKEILRQEILQRPELQQELELQNQLKSGLESVFLKKKIKGIRQQEVKQIQQQEVKQTKTRPLWVYISIAATFILAGYFVFSEYRLHRESQTLFTAYYHKTDLQINALPSFTEADTQLYEQGLADLDAGNAEAAIENLSKSKHPFASWYLALAYLKDNNRAEARKLLESIVKEKENIFNSEAKELLTKI